jgi:cytochrome P450
MATTTAPLPPGPDVPASVQAVLYHRDPLGVLSRARARFGPVFTLRFALKGPMVFVAEPSAIPALLASDPHGAHAGEARRHVLPQASARSPFGADGEGHTATRARMEPAFDPERMAAAEGEIAALAERHIASWPAGRPFRLLARMRTLAFEIFVRTVLAVRDEQRAVALVAAVRHLLWTPGNPPTPVPGRDDGPPGRIVDALFMARRAPIERLIGEEIAERRRAGGGHDDLLGMVLAAEPQATADAIVDELLVVMMAAQEPPAIALTNVAYELACRPELAARFAGDRDGELRRAAIDEALRLRPAAQAALRRLTEPFEAGGFQLPPGTTVAVPSLLAHRDPVAFPAPDQFRHERLVGGPPPGAPYLPFGGGARRCIGEPLAHAEFRAVLPQVVGRLQLRPVRPRPERMLVRGTVLVPHLGAVVFASGRRARNAIE